MRVIWVGLVAFLLFSNTHFSLSDNYHSSKSAELDLIQIEGGNVQAFDSSTDLVFNVGYIDSEDVEIRWKVKDGEITRYDGQSEFESDSVPAPIATPLVREDDAAAEADREDEAPIGAIGGEQLAFVR